MFISPGQQLYSWVRHWRSHIYLQKAVIFSYPFCFVAEAAMEKDKGYPAGWLAKWRKKTYVLSEHPPLLAASGGSVTPVN